MFEKRLSIQLRGTFLVMLSGMLYGWIGYLGSQLIHHHLSIENMLFWRFFIAMLWMLLTSLLAKEKIFKKMNQTGLMKAIIIGTLTYSGASSFYFMASQSIGTGLAMVIFFSFPIFVMLLTWLFNGWQVNKYVVISLTAVMLGLILLKGSGENTMDMMGLFLGAVAAFFYSIYVYQGKSNATIIDSRLLTLFVCLGSALVFFFVAYCNQTFFIPQSGMTWLFICLLGIFATALPIQLLLEGLKYISPVKASILSVLEPVITLMIGLMFLDESLSYAQLVGVMIVLFGAMVIQLERAVD